MALNVDKALGSLPQAVLIHEKRAGIIANNFANSETPGFKARDIDFRAVLTSQATQSSDDFAIRCTNKKHMPVVVETSMDQLMYRNISQPSLDGNTVDPYLEKAAFAENSMRYMAALTFTSERIKDLKLVIKGTR